MTEVTEGAKCDEETFGGQDSRGAWDDDNQRRWV